MTRSLAIAACVAALIAELYVVAIHAPARVDSRSRHVEWLHEFAGGAKVRQTFDSATVGLEGVALMIRARRARARRCDDARRASGRCRGRVAAGRRRHR